MDERHERMNQAAQEGNIDAFYNLIREDVNLLDYIDGLPFVDTPLHIAASAGHISFAMEMMRLKPSFARKPNPDGFSSIHLALQNEEINMVHRLLQVVKLLLASRDDIDINVKNSDGKTAWDILQEQTEVNNEEISVMLRRGRALPASSLPIVTSYATYLRRPKFIFLEKLRKNYFRERKRRLDVNRNALLVMAILQITVTYQGVLTIKEY